MTKLTNTEYADTMKLVNRAYSKSQGDPEYVYYETVTQFKRGFIRNLATFLFDNRNERVALKRWLPQDIYIRVLEALADGDHDT
jgi:hypothetical protein